MPDNEFTAKLIGTVRTAATPLKSSYVQSFVISIFLFGTLFYFNWSVHSKDMQRTTFLGRQINIAGRQRMLSQRLPKNLLLLTQGQNETEIYPALDADQRLLARMHQELLAATKEFEKTASEQQLSQLLDKITPLVTGISHDVLLVLSGERTASEILPAVLANENQLIPLIDQYNQQLANQKSILQSEQYRNQFLLESIITGIISLAVFAGLSYTLSRFSRQKSIFQAEKQSLTDQADQISKQKKMLATAISASRNETWYWHETSGDFWCSDAFWKIFGYQQETDYPESDLASFLSHIDPQASGFLEPLIYQTDDADSSFDFEIEASNRRGEQRWVRIRGERNCNINESGFTLIGTVEDIHEYMLAKLELVRNENLLTSVGTMAKVGGWSYELASKYLYWSEQTFLIHEVEADYKPTLERAFTFYAPEAQPVIQTAFENAIETGEGWDLELPLITARGRKIWVRARGEIQYENNKPVRMMGALQDITEEKTYQDENLRLQHREHESRARFEGVINAATEFSIIAADPNGIITLFSPGAERILGYSAEEMVGLQTPECFHLKEEVDKRGQELTAALGSPVENFDVFITPAKLGTYDKREWTYVCKDGSHRIVDLTVTAIRDQQDHILGYLGIAFDVTERKNIESQLERLATAVSKSTNGMVITDAEGKTEWVNDGFSRISGYQIEDLRGKKPGSVLQGEKSDPATIDYMRNKIQAGESFEAELINYHKSGTEYWISIKADPIFDQEGEFTGFIAIENDITNQKHAELELIESRERVHQLLNALPTAAYTCDQEGLITYYNQAAIDLWGQEPELLSPVNKFCGSFRLFDKEGNQVDHAECWVAIAIQESKVIYGEEVVIECPDGTRKSVLAHVNPILDSSSKITGAINVLVDISDRILLERSLRETTARLEICQRVLDQHAIVAETDLNGTIRDVNDMFCKVSGFDREETIGQTHKIVNSGYHSKEFWKNVFKIIAESGLWKGTICNKNKNGDYYWVDTTIAAMLDGEGNNTGYLAIRNDITELIEAQEAALDASRSKSEFLANMSHEIRTPLTAILGYADLLHDDPEIAEVPEKRSEAISTIQDAGKHLLTIINDILDLSKIEAGKLELEETVTQVFQILDHIESLLRPPASEKGVKLLTQIETPIPDLILSDPTRLRQILMNLVGNAVKFTEKGRIRILVRKSDLGGKEFLQFEIEDSGPGMSQQQAEKMFKAFSQADTSVTRQHGGTGLGLVISRKLARMMDGEVSLAWTQKGKGTCFQFVLPIKTLSQTRYRVSRLEKDADHIKKVGKSNTSEDQLLAGTRILLAEDGPDNQKLISYILIKAGALVEIAENGAIAYQKYQEAEAKSEPFDILLTDMQMPEMDGYSLTRKLRGENAILPIIALTAHAMAEDRQKCLDVGCDDYLSKPVNRKILIQTVVQWKTNSSEKSKDPVR